MDIEAILGMFMAPIILFVLVVAPIWIILHYRSKRQMNQGLNEEERESLALLADQAKRIRERVQTLERILDADAPGWRNRQ
ncbi:MULTISPECIES: envelope stress response membrane protein PspB [Idiomarina]|jgi:phage shock protein B|uniref:Envelope stress response membrane protein PspB n=1 Tax=Idiomarina abyssalis TaxID=86102 RepID=A0A8I1G6C2_9GAMM|nr:MULTISPECIES: envelope stress response membrane protein PspB [Idiomarina]MAB22192.1 envelope stress response membrane protein PspB [Idiomarina sp.]MAL84326.1 envelope stress response membrane protein PspB [Idiomarina sp.]MBE91630.1 envelope stress response membrane protein PspB [Idiomarina sp.]MBH95424.1 envelope stress response membrane protein PspB [Idiomarina sp.]MBJ7265865.1 envelope stress response membrane protein PspB [Idiomarina abyssalis]|tara:strand:- start:36 stop:278 length:243 start_codon:yes stop_codon:yes gene_type:complete